ncbi:MAG: hypothetical protein LC112_08730 [Flavobacteriales bacterium]|nr:hypothetical protein [Flavobacteriales bacterium]
MEDKKWRPSEVKLIEIFKQQGFDPKYQKNFVDYYNYCFDDMYPGYEDWENSDWEEDESIHISAMNVTGMYFDTYLECIANGHGEEWSHALAHTAEDGESAIYYTHEEVYKIDEELADKEVRIYAKSLGGDEYFIKYFAHLFEIGSITDDKTEKAEKYSHIYKREIANGKTEIYADKYADLMAGTDFHEIYCEDYAIAYDNAIAENKSERYATLYADKYASALVDIKRRYGISDDEEMMDFAVEKVNAYMHAWEYAQENKVDDFERFARLYENIHLNTYYADGGKPKMSNEEIDKLVLKETLEKFNLLKRDV